MSTYSVDVSSVENKYITSSGKTATFGQGAKLSPVFHVNNGDVITVTTRGSSLSAFLAKYNGEGNNYTPLVLGEGNSAVDATVTYTATEDMDVRASGYGGSNFTFEITVTTSGSGSGSESGSGSGTGSESGTPIAELTMTITNGVTLIDAAFLNAFKNKINEIVRKVNSL